MYTWTAENRLRKMETRDDPPAGVPDLTLEFKYDYLGRRVQKVVKEGGTTTLDRRYMWHGLQMVLELNSCNGRTCSATKCGGNFRHRIIRYNCAARQKTIINDGAS